MEVNGKGITETELAALPEADAVLWQDNDGPTTVVDSNDQTWFIGMYKGRLCKRRFPNKNTKIVSLSRDALFMLRFEG